MTAKFTIPKFFPNLSSKEGNSRKLMKGSLLRKIVQAQNYLWSQGRVHGAHGYEGNGNTAFIFQQSNAYETIKYGTAAADFFIGICVSTFLVPQNWNRNNQVKISFESQLVDAGSGPGPSGEVWALLEDLNGTLISYVRSGTITTTGLSSHSMTIETPVSGEFQIRILITYTPGGWILSAPTVGSRYFGVTHVSARFLEDSTYVAYTPHADFFADNFPVASVFLKRLIENTLHLWGHRTPEICQSYLGLHYFNDSSFTQVGKYVVNVADTVNKATGQLAVYCTHSGAGNEVRVLVDGVTIQTFAALSLGYQLLDITEFTIADGERTVTVEAKSTAAGADWGTVVQGVHLWESDTTGILDVPSDYQPIDENGLEGDDTITAETTNKFLEVCGVKQAFANDRWLAANRLRTLIGDWRHRTYKRFSDGSGGDLEPRINWTLPDNDATVLGRLRNITIMFESGDDSVDSIGAWDFGDADAQSGYNETPFAYPYTLTYNGHGARLGRYYIPGLPWGTALGRMKLRGRRVQPAMVVNDVTGSGPASADKAYANKGFFGVSNGETLFMGGGYTGTPEVPADLKGKWLSNISRLSSSPPEEVYVHGRLPPQNEAELTSAGVSGSRPEGLMFEIELLSAYVADAQLSEDMLHALADSL